MKSFKLLLLLTFFFTGINAQSNLQIVDNGALELKSFEYDLRDTLNPRERLHLPKNPRFWSWISDYGGYWIMYQNDKSLILETNGWTKRTYTKDSLYLGERFANSLSWLVHSSILSAKRWSGLDYTLEQNGEDQRRFNLFIDDMASAFAKRYGPFPWNKHYDISKEPVHVLNLLSRMREAMLGGNVSDSLMKAWTEEAEALTPIIKKGIQFTPYVTSSSGEGGRSLETFNLFLAQVKGTATGKGHLDSLFRETSYRIFLSLDSYSTHSIKLKSDKSYVVVDRTSVKLQGDYLYVFPDSTVTDKRVVVYTKLSDFDPCRMAEAIRLYYNKPEGKYDFDDKTIEPVNKGKAGMPLFDPYNIPQEPVFDIITTLGTIRVQLSSKTPLHRDNFARLVAGRFFDGIIFHRVIKNFMIQSGDPNTKTSTDISKYGEGDLGYWIPAEIIPELTHRKGALAAAREGDDVNPEQMSSSSQFYIVHNPEKCRHLNGKYTVFGQTIAGFDVLDKIANVSCGAVMRDMPNHPVTIITVTLVK